MTQTKALQKIVELLGKEEKFVVLPLSEYEDLLLFSSPRFLLAIEESKKDLKEGKVKSIDQVIKDLKLDGHENSTHRTRRKRV